MNEDYKIKYNELKLKYNNKKINIIWIIAILIILLIGTITIIIYNHKFQNVELGDLISISSGLVSIALAIIAIIYSISESIKNNEKEKELNNLVNNLNSGSKNINEVSEELKIDIKNLGRENKNIKNILGNLEVETKKLLEQTEIIRGYYEENNKIEDDFTESNDLKEYEENIYNNINEDNKSKKIDNVFDIKKGNLVWAQDVGDSIRLFLIIQNDIANKYSSYVTVVPITSNLNIGKINTHVEFSYSNGLDNEKILNGIILVERIKTISKENLKECIGSLDGLTMKKVNKAIKIQLDLK